MIWLLCSNWKVRVVVPVSGKLRHWCFKSCNFDVWIWSPSAAPLCSSPQAFGSSYKVPNNMSCDHICPLLSQMASPSPSPPSVSIQQEARSRKLVFLQQTWSVLHHQFINQATPFPSYNNSCHTQVQTICHSNLIIQVTQPTKNKASGWIFLCKSMNLFTKFTLPHVCYFDPKHPLQQVSTKPEWFNHWGRLFTSDFSTRPTNALA